MEINLLTLCKLQADKRLKDFYLAGNLKCAGDFDDVVFRYVDASDRQNVVFLQAKWKERANHKVTLEKFQTGSEWDLQKYFLSYLKIQDEFNKSPNNDPIFRDWSENINCHFVMYTNAIIDENIRAHVDELENPPLNIVLGENCGHAFKLKMDEAKELLNGVQHDIEIKQLIKLLKQISNKNCKNLLRDEHFKIYHAFFANTVLVKHEIQWTIRDEFLDGAFENETLLKFRDMALDWYGDEKMDAKKCNATISRDEIKVHMKCWRLHLPDWFGNQETDLPQGLCDEFIKVAFECISGNICTIKRMNKNLLKKVASLVGNIFVFDEDVAMFKFSDAKLGVEHEKVLQYLTGKLSVPQLRFDFQIENFPRLSLGFTKIDSILEQFISRFAILTGQPNDNGLEIEIKRNIGNLSDGEVTRRFLQIKDKITTWWTQLGDTQYLRKGDGFLDAILSGIIFNVMDPLKSFTGRIAELEKLHVAFQNNDGGNNIVVISQMASVSGLGGVGKSELARQYANMYSDSHDGNVIWIDAETHDTMSDCFRRLCRDSLKIPTQNADKVEMEISAIVQEVYNFFRDGKSLFIFDNAKDFKNVGPGNDGIKHFLPATKKGIVSPHFLITSRNRKWPSAVSVELDVFTGMEAEQLIKSSLLIHNDQQDTDITRLITQLHNFPLAIQQAIAYIRQTDKMHQKALGRPFKVHDYVKLYVEKTRQMLDFKFPSDCLDLYTKTTFVTWNITLAEIEKSELGKEARAIFNIMAYLNPNDIPLAFFSEVVQNSEDKLIRVINLIEEYSMISLHNGMVNIHRLVQSVTRLVLQEEQKHQCVLKDTLSLVSNHTDDKLIIQGASVWNYVNENCDLVNEYSAIPARIIKSLKHTFRYEEAFAFGEVCVKSLKRVLGTEHVGTLSSQFELAAVLNKHGKYNSALAQFQEVCDVQIRILGPDNAITSDTKQNIAETLYHQGKYEEALHSFNEVLQGRSKILGPDHSDTLTTQHDIAHTLSTLGKYEEALCSYKDVFQTRTKTLGPDHPSLLTTQRNIAQTLSYQGKYDEAMCSYKEVFEKRTELFGPDHPSTVSAKHDIAQTLSQQGKYEDALCSYREVFENECKILGQDHPSTLTTAHNIAQTLSFRGKYAEALCAYEEVFEKRTKILGTDHPSTLTTQHDIAQILSSQGKYDEALCTYNEVFQKESKTLGPDHPSTFTTQHNIAQALSDQGKYEEALSTFSEVLRKSNKILGPDHPSTLTIQHNIAQTLSCQGKFEESRCSYEKVFVKYTETLGPNHPYTLSTQHNIAQTLSEQGKYKDALSSFKEVFQKRSQILGIDHPSTLDTQQKISEILSILDK